MRRSKNAIVTDFLGGIGRSVATTLMIAAALPPDSGRTAQSSKTKIQ